MIGRIRRRVQTYLSARRMATGLRHVGGPREVRLADDAAGVVILARNAGWFLQDCLDHHFALGAAHAVVIDARSDDCTATIAMAHPKVTLLSSDLPLMDHESALRSAAARRVLQGGWVLFADPDEMAEPPAPLSLLLRYANARGFTAVLGQDIDMAPTGVAETYADARAASRYTQDGLERVPYGDPSFHLDWFTRNNPAPDPGVQMLAGGLRKMVFAEDPVLTKHVLVRNLASIDLMSHPHCAGNVTVADVTIAIRRYMFAGDWQARDRASLEAGTWGHGEDRQRLATASKPGFEIAIPSPREWAGTDALLRDGFLYASRAARSALSLKG